MKTIKNILLGAGALVVSTLSYGQGATCAEMDPICTDVGAEFTAGVGTVAEPGNDYGCLFTYPNPSWYYLEIATDGDIDMSLSAPSDIDFIIWGPFADLATAISYCGSLGVDPDAPEVDCSYSATASETPSIPGAITGEVYIMLITNYAAVVQDVTLFQTGGSGSTDCSIIEPDPCVSYAGTFNLFKNGSATTSPIYLCEGDDFDIVSNDDYTLPNDTIPEAAGGDGVYTADILWLVYDAPPATPTTDPSTDPSFTGLIIPGEDLTDINDGASDVVATLGCGTWYLVPVAGDDGIGLNGGVAGPNDNGELHWDQDGNGCWLLGEAIEITYACPIEADVVNNCDPPAVINGVDINLSGGSGDYTVINTGDGDLASGSVPNPGAATVSNMDNGDDWEIEVTDEEGCTATFSGTFSAPIIDPIVITPAASCPGSSEGNVDVTIVGGSGSGAPYTLILNGTPTAGTSANINGVAGTVVTIVATDGDGCFSDSTVTINSAGHFIDVDIVDVLGESCAGAGDGTATISAVPTPTGTVTDIVWTSPSSSTFPGDGTNVTLTDMEAGFWEVCVTDDIGCEVCIVVEIPATAGLDMIVINSNEPTCYGFSDGSITVSTNGGTPTYNYSWSPAGLGTSNTANTLGAGTYTAYVIDANGCEDSITYVLDQPEQLTVDLDLTHVLCNGDSTGIAVIDQVNNSQGDPDNVAFFWNPNPSGVSGSKADSSYAMYAGEYTLTVTDDFGCSYVIDFEITEPDAIVFTEIGYDPAYCRLFPYQSGNGVVFAAAGGGTPDFEYEWINLGDSSSTTNTTWGGLNPGVYEMTVTDANGCTLVQEITLDSLNPIAEFEMTSQQFEPATAEIEYHGTSCVDIHFVNQSENFANPNNPFADTTFWWNFESPDGAWVLSKELSETFDTSYCEAGTYEICLVAQNKNGCVDTTCKEVIVYDQIAFEGVNVFTPNGDGVNDVFTFEKYAKSIAEFRCVIVDRWGTTKHEMTSITDTWNGTDKSGSQCKDGVYFYRWEATSDNGTHLEGQGTVQILSGKK